MLVRGSYHTLNPESLQLSPEVPTWHQDTVGLAASACCAAVLFASCTNEQRPVTTLNHKAAIWMHGSNGTDCTRASAASL